LIFKKITYCLIVLSIILLSCDKEQKFYPTVFEVKETDLINLNETDLSFGEIVLKVQDTLFYSNKTLVLYFEDNKVNYFIKTFVYNEGLIKSRNLLNVTNLSGDTLTNELTKHYFNNGRLVDYSISPEKAMCLIEFQDDVSRMEFKNKLIDLISTFDLFNLKHQANLELKIFINS